MASIVRRMARTGGLRTAKRLVKAVPFVGSALALGLAGYEVRRKGLLRGAVHVGLDATPFVGTAKNLVEIITGDLISDKYPERLRISARAVGREPID